MLKWFMVLALSCVFQHAQQAAFALPSSNAPVTSVRRILSLTPAEAARHLPVHFMASVTYASRAGAMLFVQEGTNGVFVGLEQRLPPLRFGQVVEVRGRTDRS